jgi:hypothetical protein
MMQFSSSLRLLFLLTITLGFTAPAAAQMPLLLDDFNRANSPTVGSSWAETETTASTAILISSNQLRLSSSTGGRDFVTRDISSRYSPTLSTNPGLLTWACNLQQSRVDPSGFNGSNYGAAFVLAASSADLLSANGYALVYGNAGVPNNVRLVRFSGGLDAEANLTTLVSSTTTDYQNQYLTLRVTYAPDENNWSLYLSASATAFADPLTGTVVTATGSLIDATYTGQSLPYVGCLWNHATTASENAVFDNVYVSAPCPLATEPASAASAGSATVTSTTATLGWTAGSGSSRLLLLRAGQAPTAAPTDGSAYAGNAAFGSGPPLASGEYVVYNGSGSSVSLSNLQFSTYYYYLLYEAAGTGCTSNYRQLNPAAGSFTTAPCAAATAPTQAAPAAMATGVSSGNKLTLSWTAGNGLGRLVVLRAGQAVAQAPQPGTLYTADPRFGSGGSTATGEYVVYAGTGSSVTVSSLVAGQAYHAAVYEYNGSGCSTAYLTTTPARAQATAPAPPATAGYHYYRGNLHAHSGYSDGNKDAATSGAATPADDYVVARTALQLDFLGISDHNHSQAGMQKADFARGLQQADAANQDGTFVSLYGTEWGTISGGGHVIIYGYDQLIGWEADNYDVYNAQNDYTGLFAKVAARPGAVCYLAHPQTGDYNNVLTTSLNTTTAQGLVGVALRSGPAMSTVTDYSEPSGSSYEARYKEALRQGYHVGAILDHDSHYTNFGKTNPARLVMLATSLTRANLLDALQQRRFYAADDWNAEVQFQAGTAPMGSQLRLPGTPTLSVAVQDADNEAVTSIALLYGIPGSGSSPTQLTSVAGAASLSYTHAIPNGATYYYYAVITQADGDKIFTSPIRYTRDDAAPAYSSQPLPVTWLSFRTGVQGEATAVLRWATIQEKNNAYFEVQRSSNGLSFAPVGRVLAAGTSPGGTYEWSDPTPLTSRVYYRLRQADQDGSSHYSPVASVSPREREAAQAHVFPNPRPGGQTLHLALRGYRQQAVLLRVRDLTGRLVHVQPLAPDAYSYTTALTPPTPLSPGLYFLEVSSDAQQQTLQLVITE